MSKNSEAKTASYKVTSAFVWDGKVRLPKSTVTLTEREAKSLEARGKIEPNAAAKKATGGGS